MKCGSLFRARYQRLVPRTGRKRAIVAVGHSLLVLIHNMLSTNTPYRKAAEETSTKEPGRSESDIISRPAASSDIPPWRWPCGILSESFRNKADQQQAACQNRRVPSSYGKSLLRRRGELMERSFAHSYETGGMRRCHLRGRENILKRQLVHVGA